MLGCDEPHGIAHVVLVFDELTDGLVNLQVRPPDMAHHAVRPDRRGGWDVLEEDVGDAIVLVWELAGEVKDLIAAGPPHHHAVTQESVPAVHVGRQPVALDHATVVRALLNGTCGAGNTRSSHHARLHRADHEVRVGLELVRTAPIDALHHVDVHYIGGDKIVELGE